MTRTMWTCIAVLALSTLSGSAADQTPAARGGGRSSAGAATAGGRQARPATPSAGAGPVIVLETVRGTIEFETYPAEAPKTVEHILALVRRNFYNGQRVHRVEPNDLVQFGDPQTRNMTKRDVWGTGGSGRPIGVAEFSPKHPHRAGTVAVAHAGDAKFADSQMYILLAPRRPELDGKYTVLGQVISGMDVVRALKETDIIRKVSVRPASAAAPASAPKK